MILNDILMNINPSDSFSLYIFFFWFYSPLGCFISCIRFYLYFFVFLFLRLLRIYLITYLFKPISIYIFKYYNLFVIAYIFISLFITVFCALQFAIGILSHLDSYAIAVRYLCYRVSIPMLSRCDTYVIATP